MKHNLAREITFADEIRSGVKSVAEPIREKVWDYWDNSNTNKRFNQYLE
jgi:hypothetical protein